MKRGMVMSKRDLQLYIQVFITVLFAVMILLQIVHLLLRKKINKKAATYNEEKLIDVFLETKRKYNLVDTLEFTAKGVPFYNMVEQKISMKKSQLFGQSDYIALLHETSHAIDFSRKKNDIMMRIKGASVLTSIGGYILGLVSLFYVSETIGLLFVSIAAIAGLVDIGVTMKMERDANNILLSDLLDRRYKLFVIVMEALQMVERILIFICLLILFLIVRAGFVGLR